MNPIVRKLLLRQAAKKFRNVLFCVNPRFVPLICAAWVCCRLQAQTPADFEQAYAPEVQSAFAWLADNATLINQELGRHEAPLILALAFPEVVRYNELSNLIETKALELAYTRRGYVSKCTHT